MNTEQITNSIPPELLAWLTETFSSFAAIAVVVFLAFALWGAFQGFRRSIFRQVIHVAVTFLTAVIAFNCTSFVCDSILNTFTDMTPAQFVAALEGELASSGIVLEESVKNVILNFDMDTIGYTLALTINTLVAPLVFAILFGLIALLGKIVTSVVCFFVPKGQSLTYKLIGVAGGILEGALIAGVVLLPLVGWVNIAGNAVDVVRENAPEDDESATQIVEFYDDVVLPLEKHAIFQMVGSLGGNAALTDIATVEVDGVERDLRDEFNVLVKLGYDVSRLSNADFLALSEGDKSVIDSIIDDCDSSIVVSRITCGVVNGLADAVANGAINVEVTDNYYAIIMEAVSILGSEKTNPTTLKANLTTFKNVYFLLSDEGVLAVFERTEDGEAATTESKLTEALTQKDAEGNTVLNKVINELDKNENTRSLIPLVGKIAISALYDTLGIPENAEEAYEKVKEGIQDVLTTDTEAEGAKEAIADSLADTLEGIGITVSNSGEEGTISSEALDVMAEYVMDKQDEIKEKLESENIDIENISDADVLNVLLSYYTDYLQGNN